MRGNPNGGKLIFSPSGGENGVKFNPWPRPIIRRGPKQRAEVNGRPRLNFTEGTKILYHSPNKRAVSICFIGIEFDFLVRTEP